VAKKQEWEEIKQYIAEEQEEKLKMAEESSELDTLCKIPETGRWEDHHTEARCPNGPEEWFLYDYGLPL